MASDDREAVYDRVDAGLSAQTADDRSQAETMRLACRILAYEGHSDNLAGQITARSKDIPGHFATLCLGALFEEIEVDQVCVIDDELNVVASDHRVNPALRFHLWIYRARPDVGCVVHCHTPAASALSMLGRPLAVSHMDTCIFYEDCAFLPEWPGVPFSDVEGEIISTAIADKRAILLAHHGYLTTGATIEEATYLAVFFERAARMQLLAEAAGTIQDVAPEAAREAHDFLLQQGIVSATFDAWGRRATAR